MVGQGGEKKTESRTDGGSGIRLPPTEASTKSPADCPRRATNTKKEGKNKIRGGGRRHAILGQGKGGLNQASVTSEGS